MRRRRVLLGIGALVLSLSVAIGVAYAAPGDPVQHGISLTKGCVSPIPICQAYTCSFSVRNTIDEAQDTLTFNELPDTVHASGGDVARASVQRAEVRDRRLRARLLHSAVLLGSGRWATAASGIRSRNATSCTLPFGSRLNVLPFSFYTVQPADFNLPATRSPTRRC